MRHIARAVPNFSRDKFPTFTPYFPFFAMPCARLSRCSVRIGSHHVMAVLPPKGKAVGAGSRTSRLTLRRRLQANSGTNNFFWNGRHPGRSKILHQSITTGNRPIGRKYNMLSMAQVAQSLRMIATWRGCLEWIIQCLRKNMHGICQHGLDRNNRMLAWNTSFESPKQTAR